MDWRALTRPIRRLFRPFLTEGELGAVADAIAAAEKGTTGEIRVHVVGALGGLDPLEAAKRAFASLGMEKTRARNGVIVLVSHLDHRFAIWGDEGIHAKAGQQLWDRAARALESGLRAGRPAGALEACVREVGAALALHFPRGAGDDPNELPDDVSRA